jgi:spermidine dehydrogenase
MERMSEWTDRELGMDRGITRRDFLDGVAVGAGALALGSVLPGCGDGGDEGVPDTGAVADPDRLTGLQGHTDSAMEIPHQLRDGTFWEDAGTPTDTGERYDLVVVGAGISGLAAARFFQHEAGEGARILILDPLTQPGGHAARNEFVPEGSGARLLLGYGGSQSLDTPTSFARPTRRLLDDVGVEVQRFRRYFDRGFNRRHGLGRAYFFDRETYGRNQLVLGEVPEVFEKAPLNPRAKADLTRLYSDPPDPFPGLTETAKKELLTDLTYEQFLRRHLDLDEQALSFLRRLPDDLWGYGTDGVGAIDAWADGYPGFDGLGLSYARPFRTNAPTEHKLWYSEDPYIFHFPDGNGGVARSIIRRLNPAAMPGHGMDTIPTTELDYGRLDEEGSAVRIRLQSPVVRVRHRGEPDSAREVEVAYVRDGELQSVTGDRVVLACWNAMIPYLCEELPARQKRALGYATKLSLMYANVQIRNWTSFAELGIAGAVCRTMYWLAVSLDFPVSMGTYRFPDSPEEPIVLHLPKAMTKPGLPPREQGRAGREELIATPFEEIERTTRDQVARVLADGGFDPARDIEAITVNRWAHAYAYEYGRPWDRFWPDGELPSEVARRPFGRIAIANSDSAPRAYADSAIDMGYRAVRELLGKPAGEVARGVDGVVVEAPGLALSARTRR